MKNKNSDLEIVTRRILRVELGKFGKEFKREFKRVDKRMDAIIAYMNAKFVAIEEKMYTKEEHDNFMILIDAALTEVRAAREERILSERHILLMDDRLDNHEKRIGRLEVGIA